VTTISTKQAVALDPGRWPGIAVAAGSPARAAVARALFTSAVARLPLRIRLPDGRLPHHQMLGAGAPSAPVMLLPRPRSSSAAWGSPG